MHTGPTPEKKIWNRGWEETSECLITLSDIDIELCCNQKSMFRKVCFSALIYFLSFVKLSN
ncbi:hypothetical protein BLOT_016319 [Blomia tropicalis]|nr:hypothetical protein BLOT_016319 [Blomia tropicalis]